MLKLPDKPLTFSDYYKLNPDLDLLLEVFDYHLERGYVELPKMEVKGDRIESLQRRLEETIPFIEMTSETARREFLIAPIIFELVHLTHVIVKVEYMLQINERLKGTIDYFLQAGEQFLVVEAKNADIERGFTQLAMELIAMAEWKTGSHKLYGAVSTGEVWRFGILDRDSRSIIRDSNSYYVPKQVEELLQVLVALLTQNH